MMCFFWKELIIEVMLPELNKYHEKTEQIFFPGFLQFIVCIHFISCFDSVSDQNDWWYNKVLSKF